MSFTLTAIAIALLAISGIPSQFIKRNSVWGQRIAVLLVCSAAVLGLFGAGFAFFSPVTDLYVFPWLSVGSAIVGIDTLSAFFLVPIFIVGSLASVYGCGYWNAKRNARTARRLQLFYGFLLAGMALLVISRHAMAFILGWEAMALSAFFLVATEDDKEESRKSAFVYIIATHIGTLTLFALFTVWHQATGSFDLTPIASLTVSKPYLHALFFLAFFGFGMKAGIMPLHFWLPGAHANAPSHVSAILSGIMLKMGIYGLVRILSLLSDPPALWGWWILFFGMVSGLLGVVFAIAQHDLKKLLAYHSVENIGIIFLGLGVAMLGRSYHQNAWILLGMAGCLLHVWNHSFFKSLLFMGAGSVLHATHTRQIDRMGALASRMPWTAALFLIGAIAICGLPPLNGFISEFFVYIGLFSMLTDSPQSGMLAVFAVPVLAMIGALAVACFVKVYGIVFLGLSRTDQVSRAHESPMSMIIPMIVLSVVCFCIGVAPIIIAPFLEKAIAVWLHSSSPLSTDLRLEALVPLGTLSVLAFVLLVSGIIVVFLFSFKNRSKKSVETWSCGYAMPTSRMQYSATSFAHSLVGLFDWFIRPKKHGAKIVGVFPLSVHFESHVDEVVLDRCLLPFSRFITNRLYWLHRFQQGQTQQYLFYILIALSSLLLTMLPYKKIAEFLFK